jgi:hypothetical protein
MIRRPSIVLSLAAFAALTVLSACDGNNPVSSPGAPDQGMSPTRPTASDMRAQSDDVTADGTAVEFEGTVTKVLLFNPNWQSKFVIAGRIVIINPPNWTQVLVDGKRGSVADVTVGSRVHVKGMTVARPQPAVSAREVRVLSSGGGGTQASCAAPGARVEVEGTISSKGSSSITVFQQGKGSYLCQVGGGTSIRKGNKSYSFGQLQNGWRVHVKGDSQGSSGGACSVASREIQVQNTGN